VTAVRSGSDAWKALSPVRRIVEVGVVLLATVLGPFLFWFVRDDPSIRYNAFSSLAVGIALFATLGPFLLSPSYSPLVEGRTKAPRWRFVLVALSILVILAQIFLTTRDLGGHYLSNQRDFAFANRLLDRIERHPSYAEMAGGVIDVGIEGRFRPYFDDRPFRYQAGRPVAFSILGCGAVDCQAGRIVSALNLLAVDGTVFRSRPAEEIAAEAGLQLGQLPRWPADDSITLLDGSLLIKAR
jgi:hypothetical protein